MNFRLPVTLLFTVLLFVSAQSAHQSPPVLPNAAPQLTDGSQCIPWTPTSCPKPLKRRATAAPATATEIADGGQCIPWTPTSCPLKSGARLTN